MFRAALASVVIALGGLFLLSVAHGSTVAPQATLADGLAQGVELSALLVDLILLLVAVVSTVLVFSMGRELLTSDPAWR